MRRAVVIGTVGALVVAAGGGGTAYYLSHRSQQQADDAAQRAVDELADGWNRRNVSGVPFADAKAAATFAATTGGLNASAVAVRASQVKRTGDAATAVLNVTWTLAGGVTWTYQDPVAVRRNASGAGGSGTSAGSWQVAAPTNGNYWQPQLAAGGTMTAARVNGNRGNLLDRNGKALMPMGTVYPVQLDPTRATPATAAALEKIVQARSGTLVAKLAAAQKANSKAPIAVITYREADFAARRAALDALVGVIYPKTVQPLASDREFAQPLLGTYGEVTAEIVKESGGRYVAGDRAGLSGLQRSFDTVLAGTPGLKVTSSTGQALFTKAAVDGTDVQTTLDPAVQRAAEKALSASGSIPSALVAIDVRTGDILASANHPWYGFDRAITGRFPPGSTFKVASTYALLTKNKISLNEKVTCPSAFTVDGKAFRNYEGETLGTPVFAVDFSHSCNTAFVQLAARLGDSDLSTAAKALGIGAGWGATLGVSGAFDGSIPQNNGKTDQAAAMIGQGRDEVSPLSLAVMSGSIARGTYIPPALVTSTAAQGSGAATPDASGTDASSTGSSSTVSSSMGSSSTGSSSTDTSGTGSTAGGSGSSASSGSGTPAASVDRTPVALDAQAVANLRTVMRAVVTSGTGTVLASAAGGPVFGKTGTAEFGSGSSPETHAWFTGYQGDVAFAVLVEQGKSGGTVAAPIAKTFLAAL